MKRAWNAVSGEKGFSLLELAVASALLAIILVPAVKLLPGLMRIDTKSDRATLVVHLAQLKTEEVRAVLENNFAANVTSSGDFTAQGEPEYNYDVTASDSMADGGVSGALMAVALTVWHDADGDGLMDTGEESVRFDTAIAKRVT